MMTTNDPKWLVQAREMAETMLWPMAQASDQAAGPPVENIRRLAQAGLLGVNVPVEFGGQGGGMAELAELFEALASGCGVTTFVALQHMLACSYLARSANETLRNQWLRDLGAGRVMATVAFSQVRRPGPPVMKCARKGDVYVFEGNAPWSTGWGVASRVVLGGTLDDGRLVFALTATDVKGLSASEPIRLCAMNASATVTLSCREVEVGEKQVIKIITRDEMAKSDRRGMFLIAHLSHGVTRAAVRLLKGLQAQRPSDAIAAVVRHIEQMREEIRTEANQWVEWEDDPDYGRQAVRVRSASISLSLKAAQAAVMASGGTGTALDHPAQRLFREAMLYSLTAQTRDLQGLMLGELAQ